MIEELNIPYIANQLPRRGNWPSRMHRDITDITIHHTAAHEKDAAQIARAHLNRHLDPARRKSKPQKPWPGIAYHYVIFPDGTAQQTQPDRAHSSHNGFNNKHAIAVTMVGNFEDGPPTDAQFNAAMHVCGMLKALYPSIRYCVGHREYEGATACPGKHVDMHRIRALLQLGINPAAKKPDAIKA